MGKWILVLALRKGDAMAQMTHLLSTSSVSASWRESKLSELPGALCFLLSDTSKTELISDIFLYDKLPPRSFPQHSDQVNLRGLMHACTKCCKPSQKLSSQWTLNCVEKKVQSKWLYLMHLGCLKISLLSILGVTLYSFYFLPVEPH